MKRFPEDRILEGEILLPEERLAPLLGSLSKRVEPAVRPSYYRRRQEELERVRKADARVAAQLLGIEKNRQELLLRDPVSKEYELEELEFFASRLLRDNAAKQAQPDIVARHVNRTMRELGIEPSRATKRTKLFDTAYVSQRHGVVPRTVFGTDAWIRTGSSMRKKFITKVLALPCVQRSVRREVMFARKKAGHGYKVRHRPAKFSDIWC